MTICKTASQSIQTEPERTNGLKMTDTEYPVTYLGSPDWYLSIWHLQKYNDGEESAIPPSKYPD